MTHILERLQLKPPLWGFLGAQSRIGMLGLPTSDRLSGQSRSDVRIDILHNPVMCCGFCSVTGRLFAAAEHQWKCEWSHHRRSNGRIREKTKMDCISHVEGYPLYPAENTVAQPHSVWRFSTSVTGRRPAVRCDCLASRRSFVAASDPAIDRRHAHPTSPDRRVAYNLHKSVSDGIYRGLSGVVHLSSFS